MSGMHPKATARVVVDGASSTAVVVTDPNENDVLLGRGLPSVRFEGNIGFRRICLGKKREYSASRQHAEKDSIARSIVEEVHRRGGRFLRRVRSRSEGRARADSGGEQGWVEIEEKEAIEKVKQTLRDTNLQPPGSAATGAEGLMAGTFSTAVPSRPRAASLPSVKQEKPSASLSGRQLEHAPQDHQYSNVAELLLRGQDGLRQFGGPMTQNQLDQQHLSQQISLSDQYRQMMALPPVQRVGVLLELPRAYQDVLPYLLANRAHGQPPLSAEDVILLQQSRHAAILINDFARVAQVDAVFHTVKALMGREAAELQGLSAASTAMSSSGRVASLPFQQPQHFGEPTASSNSTHRVSSYSSSAPQNDERKPPARMTAAATAAVAAAAAAAAAAHKDQSPGDGTGRRSGEEEIIDRTSRDHSTRAQQEEMSADSEAQPVKKRAKRNRE